MGEPTLKVKMSRGTLSKKTTQNEVEESMEKEHREEGKHINNLGINPQNRKEETTEGVEKK